MRTHSLYLFIYIFLLGPWHMEAPRPGVELEVQPLAYATTKATPDLSHICNLCLRMWQHRIPNPLCEARDGTCILTVTSWVLNPLSHKRNAYISFSFFFSFLFLLFKVTRAAYGSWGRIGATDAGLCHSHRPQQQGMRAASVTYITAHGNTRIRILDPLSEARD